MAKKPVKPTSADIDFTKSPSEQPEVSEAVDNEIVKTDESRTPRNHFKLARKFADGKFNRKSHHFKHCEENNQWYHFKRSKWVKSRKAVRLAIVKFLYEQHSALSKSSDVRSIAELAADRMDIGLSDFDANPFKLGTPKETIDLELTTEHPSGSVTEPVSTDYITMNTNVDMEKGDPVQMLEFLQQAIPDEETREWLWLMLGQALIGIQTEHVFIYIHGPPGSGKTTFIETIKKVLGDYAGDFPKEYLIKQRGNLHPTGETELKGKRIVFANEVEGAEWDVNRIKLITGGGGMKSRKLYENFTPLQFTHTLIAAGNNLPAMRFETAMEQRLRVVKFHAPEQFNHNLERVLANEAPQILCRMVNAAIDYQQNHFNQNPSQRNSLYIPEQVKNDTQAYLKADVHKFRELVGEDKVFLPTGEIRTSLAVELANKAMPDYHWSPSELKRIMLRNGIKYSRTDARRFEGISANPAFVRVKS